MESTLSKVQLDLQSEVRDVVNSIPHDYVNDVHADKIKYPKEVLRLFGQSGFFGVRAPKKYGGRGLGWKEQVIVSEELGVPGLIFGCVAGVTGNVVTEALVNFASEEIKQKYLVPIIKGDIFAAECLTEPRGGSDFFGSTTTAVRDGDDYILSGEKRFIVGGEGADVFLTYAKTNLEPGATNKNSLTCFVVERDFGVDTEYLFGLMGSKGGGTARVVFDNVRVPKENVVGEVNGAYPIFWQMMVPERMGTSCMSVGATRPALEIATDYTTKRKAFGTQIKNFQGVNFQIAEAAMLMDATRAFQQVVAQALDNEFERDGINSGHARRLVSEVKRFTSESMQKVAHISMQVMGGIGYTDIYPVERIVRDLRLASIWVGSNEIMSSITQHEWYRFRAKELKNTNKRNSYLDAAGALDTDEIVYE